MKSVSVSDCLVDLVKMGIMAKRNNMGDILWYCWEGTEKKKCVPGHGTTLVGFTQTGAAQFLWHLERSAPGHLDDMLTNWLKQQKDVEHCWIWPSIGNYTEHVSGCEPNLGRRENTWNKFWAAPGTTDKEAGGKRYFASFCGGDIWGPRVFIEGIDWWKTLRTPEDEEAIEKDYDNNEMRLSSRGKRQRRGLYMLQQYRSFTDNVLEVHRE